MEKIILISFLLFNTISFSQTDSTYVIDINNIILGIDNKGGIGIYIYEYNNNYYSGGTFNNIKIFHSAGFAITGKDDSQLWGSGMIPSSSIEDYLPGKVGSEPNNEENKIYAIKSGDQDFGESWQEWKDAVELGAYFYDGNNDSLYNPVDLNGNGKWDADEDMPDLIGDLSTWSVFNDTNVDTFGYLATEPKGIEIKQSIFLSASPNAGDLGNVVFIRYIIENIGTISDGYDSVYFSFFIDPDIGDHQDDLTGCDTILQVGYAYNKGVDDIDGYGINPPSIILNPLQSPHEFIAGETYIDNNANNIFDENIDTPLDTAIIKRGSLLGKEKIIGARNLSWSAFSPYYRHSSNFWDPHNTKEIRNYMEGGKYKDGSLIDVATFEDGNGETLGGEADLISPKYIFSGNPVDSTGWLPKKDFNGADFRMLLSYGPFTLRKDEPVEVMAAYVVGRGDSHLTSITEAFRINEEVQALYDNNFNDIPVGVVRDESPSIPADYRLSQNYPNPFNPTTIIEYQIPKNGFVNLIVYNTLGQEVLTLVSEHQTSGKYSVQFNASNLPSGVYFYKIESGSFSKVKKMLFLR